MEENKKGLVFNIERHALHDGPGIRTLVFLKGCPLRCRWCSNPESWNCIPQRMYDRRKCSKCLACIRVCPNGSIGYVNEELIYDSTKCDLCGRCVDECLNDALRISGKLMSVDEVLQIVLRDRAFYKTSGGGITVSGGEPFYQIDFLEELLTHSKKHGLHTAIETTGFAPWADFARIVDVTDLFLYDVKHVDSQKHTAYTGVPCEPIQHNLKTITGLGKKIIVRIPLIPGFNAYKEDMQAIAQAIKLLPGIDMVHILPYHQLGIPKYRELGIAYAMHGEEPLDYNAAKGFLPLFTELGINAALEV